MFKSKYINLYNVIFPIWLLWILPITWIVVLPANFIIDSAVIIITLMFFKIKNIKTITKKAVIKTWLFGFLADIIGTLIMFSSNLIEFDYDTSIGKWWYDNISSAVSYNPFKSIYSILWVILCIIITSTLIYIFNYKICFNNTELNIIQRKKVAFSLAIFTAPYLFIIPTYWFY